MDLSYQITVCSTELLMFAPSVGYGHLYRCYAADFAWQGIEKNGHVAYRLDASKLVRFSKTAGAPAS
jgi:hypothetical protein